MGLGIRNILSFECFVAFGQYCEDFIFLLRKNGIYDWKYDYYILIVLLKGMIYFEQANTLASMCEQDVIQ